MDVVKEDTKVAGVRGEMQKTGLDGGMIHCGDPWREKLKG